MKHLKTFEDFETQIYAVGDIVKVNVEGNEVVAKISDVNSKNSYLVQISKNGNNFMPKKYQVKRSNILEILKPNNNPAMSSDWVTQKYSNPSNDLVINGGYPDTPLANIMPF